MSEHAELSELIGHIYDAAIGTMPWPLVLAMARDYVGGHAAAIYALEATSNSGTIFHHDDRIGSDYRESCFAKHMRLDPLTTAYAYADIGRPVAPVDYLPAEEFQRMRFFRKWVAPQGFVDLVSTVLDRSLAGAALFDVLRRAEHGAVGDRARQRMALIAPHMRRAVLVARMIDLKSVEAATLAAATDGIRTGMLLVDPRRQIIHANASAHVMLEEASVVRTTQGRFHVSEKAADQHFGAFLAQAAQGLARADSNADYLHIRAEDGADHIIHMLPLACGATRQSVFTPSAVAAIFINKAALDTTSPLEVIAKAFRLTPTELRVLLGIVEVGGVPETAAALGIAEATVKTHLHAKRTS